MKSIRLFYFICLFIKIFSKIYFPNFQPNNILKFSFYLFLNEKIFKMNPQIL